MNGELDDEGAKKRKRGSADDITDDLLDPPIQSRPSIHYTNDGELISSGLVFPTANKDQAADEVDEDDGADGITQEDLDALDEESDDDLQVENQVEEGDDEDEDEDEDMDDDEEEVEFIGDFDRSKKNLRRAEIAEVMASAKKRNSTEIPFTFPAPRNYSEFAELIAPFPELKDRVTIISRIRTLYHASLAPENREKISALYGILVSHLEHVGDDTPFKLNEINTTCAFLADMAKGIHDPGLPFRERVQQYYTDFAGIFKLKIQVEIF